MADGPVDVPRPRRPGEGDRDVVEEGRDLEGRTEGELKASSRGRISKLEETLVVDVDVDVVDEWRSDVGLLGDSQQVRGGFACYGLDSERLRRAGDN
jgi:hypothetical protein